MVSMVYIRSMCDSFYLKRTFKSNVAKVNGKFVSVSLKQPIACIIDTF